MIHLADPLYLLLGLLLLLPWLVPRQRAWQYSSLHLLPAARPGSPLLWLPTTLMTVASVLLLLALARPQRGTTQTEPQADTRDIVLTLDISFSMDGPMAGQPVEPCITSSERSYVSKLQLMQQAAWQFIQRRLHDRIGLVVFGDEAFGLWPLSTDKSILHERLQRLPGLLPAEVRGTRVAQALGKALDYLHTHGQARSKVLLLLTDGLDTIESPVLEQLIQRLQSSRITLYVLGIDLLESSPILQLARQAQARYFNITEAAAFEATLQDIDRLETSTVNVRQHTEYRELYWAFAAPGLALLVLGLLLQSTWIIDL